MSVIQEKFFADACWSLGDVIDAAAEQGVVMTAQQAYDWWKKNENWFRECLVERGNEILANVDFGNENPPKAMNSDKSQKRIVGSYKEIARYANATVSIMRCEHCGHTETTWSLQGNTERIDLEE